MKEAIIHWRNQQSDFLKFLKDKGYSKSSLGHYRGCLDDLIRYANAVEATDGVAPTPTLLAEKPTTENVNRYISYKNVAAKANEGKYYIFEDVQLYGATGALKPTEDGNYDVEGIYILYNGTTPELIVTAIEKSSSTAINNAVVSEKAVKMIENGQLIIMKNGVKYNAQGAELR